MFLKSKNPLYYLILLAIVSFNLLLSSGTAESSEIKQTIVLFDESHGQFFNRSLYIQALSDLQDENLRVIFNTAPLNRTTLDGVDIFVSTDPSDSFLFEERNFITDFLLDGKSLLFLSNPLDETNESLNGHGFILNEVLSDAAPDLGEAGALIKFYTKPGSDSDITPTDVVKNDFSNIGNPNQILIPVNTSGHEILFGDQNVTSILTYSCSVQQSRENIIAATSGAYAVTTQDEIHAYSSEITIFGSAGPLESGAHVLLGGSSIMFSDLKNPYFNTTWYQTENNSLLWKNMFDWLEHKEIEDTPLTYNSDVVIIFLLSITIISMVLLVGGSVLFFVGSGRKVKIVKSEEIIPVVPVKKPAVSKEQEERPTSKATPTSKETKRDRRLRQIKKGTRKKKR